MLVAPNGGLAYVSVHYRGRRFGLDVVRYDPAARRLQTLARLDLDGSGFTAGGAKPANFPIEAATVGDDTVLVAYARGVASGIGNLCAAIASVGESAHSSGSLAPARELDACRL